jgi:hypothetical protein
MARERTADAYFSLLPARAVPRSWNRISTELSVSATHIMTLSPTSGNSGQLPCHSLAGAAQANAHRNIAHKRAFIRVSTEKGCINARIP